MLPQSIICEDCGAIAKVRGYGRVEYTPPADQNLPTVEFKLIRLTVDCPQCGVKVQEYHPAFQLSTS